MARRNPTPKYLPVGRKKPRVKRKRYASVELS